MSVRLPKSKLPKSYRCPFCGGKAITVASDVRYWVVCVGLTGLCGFEGPARKTERGAIEAWNRIRVEKGSLRNVHT